jgi:AraC-like DNA-binding protein
MRTLELRAARQAALPDYVARFGIAPRFAAPRDAISFDAACLAWPLPTRDAYLGGILERVAAEHAAQAREAPWSTRARARVAELLLHGRPVTLAAAAVACGVAVATLRARLAAEGLTFRRLFDETRRALAEEHLARGMSATSVAYLLGFSEPAAFQHACKRWFGKAAGGMRGPA